MKTSNYIKILTSFCLLIPLFFVTGCEDDDPVSDDVVLLSFGPSGVEHGDEIVFIGENMDRVTSIVLQPDITIERSQFTNSNKGSFTVIVPAAAEAGKIYLNTPDGQIESKSILNFKVDVVVSSYTTSAKPGTNITIQGTNINWIESITFGKQVVVKKEAFVSLTQTELVVTVPLEAQSDFLIFATGGTEPMTFGTDEEVDITIPTFTSFSPAAVTHTQEVTFTGTDLDLITEIILGNDVSVLKANFVSQSETQIVIVVPPPALTGTVTLKQASPLDITTVEELSIILPVGTVVDPSPAVPGEDDLTITGTNLDLVNEIILPDGVSVPSSGFTSQTSTEIVFPIPAEAVQGAIEYVTIHDYSAPLGVILKLPSAGGFPALDYYIYKDGVESSWQEWGGWGHTTKDFSNGENPANGDMAIKMVFNDQYGAVQFGNGTGSTDPFAGFNYLVFYVYIEGTGDDYQTIVQVDDNSDYYVPGVSGNKYHQIVVPLADLPYAHDIKSELRIKNNNADLPTTMFIDEVGLTVDYPMGLLPDLVTVIFDDALQSPFGLGGGWGNTTSDGANEEQARAGSVSVKGTFASEGGAVAQFGTWGNSPLQTAGTTHFDVSIYGGAGTDGNTVNVMLNDGSGWISQPVIISEGKWVDARIALSDFGSLTEISEIAFSNPGDWAGDIWVDHVGLE